MPPSWTTSSTCLDFDAKVADYRLGLCIVHVIAHCLALGSERCHSGPRFPRRPAHSTRDAVGHIHPRRRSNCKPQILESPCGVGRHGLLHQLHRFQLNEIARCPGSPHRTGIRSGHGFRYIARRSQRRSFLPAQPRPQLVCLGRCPCPEHPRRPRRCQPAVFRRQ